MSSPDSDKSKMRALAFGETLRQLRTAKGFSQEGFGFECGLDRTYISGIERGVRNPTLTTIGKIVDALAISLPEFFHKMEDLPQTPGSHQ